LLSPRDQSLAFDKLQQALETATEELNNLFTGVYVDLFQVEDHREDEIEVLVFQNTERIPLDVSHYSLKLLLQLLGFPLSNVESILDPEHIGFCRLLAELVVGLRNPELDWHTVVCITLSLHFCLRCMYD